MCVAALIDKTPPIPYKFLHYRSLSGRNSAVECQLPKLDVAGSTPVARSKIFNGLHVLRVGHFYFRANFGIVPRRLLCFVPSDFGFFLLKAESSQNVPIAKVTDEREIIGLSLADEGPFLHRRRLSPMV